MKLTITSLAFVLAAGTCGGGEPTPKTPTPVKTVSEKSETASKDGKKTTELEIDVKRVESDPLGPGTDAQMQLLVAAKSAFLAEEWEKAKTLFTELTNTGPISGPQVTAYIALTQLHRDDEELEKALPLLEKLQEKASNVAEAQFIVARTYADLGESTKAIKAYEKTIYIQPDYLQALVELAGLYTKVGREEEGAKLFYNYEQQVYKLAKTLESKETAVADKLHILDVFSFVDDDRANQAILASLKAQDPNVRYAAIQIAIDLKLGAARETLSKMKDVDPEMRVRMLAKEALSNLEGAPTSGAAPVKETQK